MKNAKKILLFALALVALTLVMSISIFAETEVVEVSTEADLLSWAKSANYEGKTLKLTNDLTISGYLRFEKHMTLDLNGYTLYTSHNNGGIQFRYGAASVVSNKVDEQTGEIVRGKLVYSGVVAAIKVFEGGTIKNIDIECTYAGGDKTVGGIVIQSSSYKSHLNLIENVKIYGVALSNGIETYLCGDTTYDTVIDAMKNVEIVATKTDSIGMNICAPIGTVEGCKISGDKAGVFLWNKNANYRSTVTLENCEVSGGDAAIEIQIQGLGKETTLNADAATASKLSSTSGVTITNTSYGDVDSDDLTFEVPGYEQNADGSIASKACETHNYTETTVDATCTTAGSITKVCSACGDTQVTTIPTLEHNYVEDVTKRVEPTANEEGSKTFVCSNCNGEKTEVIPKLEYTTHKVANSTEFDNAYSNAKDGDVILLTADFSIVWKKVEKRITIDLGGHTLTCTNGHRAFILDKGSSIINGKIIYTGNVGVIQIYNADKLENLELVMTCNVATKTVTGITLLSGTTSRVNSIKNVTIKGPETSLATIVGIETYLCGNAVNDVIGSMENVTIDVQNIGMKLIAPVGTATNCTISAGDVGILIATQNDSSYTSKINLVGCTIEGGNAAVSGNVTGGTVNFAADSESSFTSDNGPAIAVKSTSNITFAVPGYEVKADGSIGCVAHNYAETTEGTAVTYTCTVCGDKYVIDNAVVNGTYYAPLEAEPFAVFENGVVTTMGQTLEYTYNVTTGELTVGGIAGKFVYSDGVMFCRNQRLHTHDNLTVNETKATCTEDGSIVTICQVCGPIAEETIKATGHNYTSVETETEITYTCTGCGDSYAEEITPDHTHTEVIIPAVPGELRNPGMTSGVMCSECGEVLVAPVTADGNFRFNAVNLSLGESVAIQYFVKNPSAYTNVYVVFDFAGEKHIVNEYKVEEGTGNYIFVFNKVRLQSMADLVTATVYAEKDGVVSANSYSNYSVKTYIVNQLNKAGNTAKLKTMLSDLLVLGAKTQVYMNYKKDQLMTADVEDILTTSTYNGIPANEFVQQMIVNDADTRAIADWKSVSLTFKDAMALAFELKIDPNEVGNIEIKVTIPGVNAADDVRTYTVEDMVYNAETGKYELLVNNIKALQYGKTVVGDIYHNGVKISRTVNYSVNSYLQKNQDSTNVALRDFLRAAYTYGQAVKAYNGK